MRTFQERFETFDPTPGNLRHLGERQRTGAPSRVALIAAAKRIEELEKQLREAASETLEQAAYDQSMREFEAIR